MSLECFLLFYSVVYTSTESCTDTRRNPLAALALASPPPLDIHLSAIMTRRATVFSTVTRVRVPRAGVPDSDPLDLHVVLAINSNFLSASK